LLSFCIRPIHRTVDIWFQKWKGTHAVIFFIKCFSRWPPTHVLYDPGSYVVCLIVNNCANIRWTHTLLCYITFVALFFLVWKCYINICNIVTSDKFLPVVIVMLFDFSMKTSQAHRQLQFESLLHRKYILHALTSLWTSFQVSR